MEIERKSGGGGGGGGGIWKGLFALKSCTRNKLSVIVLCVNLGRLW